MGANHQTLLANVNATLDWWRAAGVDCAFDDAPRQWIVAPRVSEQVGAPVDPSRFPAVDGPPPAMPPPPRRAMIGGDRTRWPAAFPAFAEWWLNEPSLDNGQVRERVPPRGPVAAPLMILVPEPEAQDSESLLSGPHGRLLAAMLAAMDLGWDQVYLASALPRHMPMADWPNLAAHGLGDVLRLHVALARPQRLIAFGRHISSLWEPAGLESPLAGTVPTQTMPILPQFSDEGRSVPLLVARDLGSLLERPIAKGHFWQHWLEYSAGWNAETQGA